MADSSNQLQPILDRLHHGDPTARDELFQHVAGRLERLTRKMLHHFPTVHRWAGTDDVLQGALIRLLRSLETVRPATPREFLGLAAEQIRRELIDLARQLYGPQGLGANHASRYGAEGSGDPLAAQPERTDEPSLLGAWCEFHEQVRGLPPDEREVIDLLFYQELTQAQAAALLQVTVRTVQRRWQSALLRLHSVLKSQWPGVEP
ncbi:MAG: RNA polymerase sigma factor [Gemmataceae bacterium]